MIGKNIGEGTFGKVKAGTHNVTGEKVSVEIFASLKDDAFMTLRFLPPSFLLGLMSTYSICNKYS